jgi:hypothetical protein
LKRGLLLCKKLSLLRRNSILELKVGIWKEERLLPMDQVTIMIMSGVDDGASLDYHVDRDGVTRSGEWTLTIGRKDDNDLCLRNDTFVSRYHAKLHWREGRWWLQDDTSTNGSFTENELDTFIEDRLEGTISIDPGQLFRVGRTWLRIEAAD